MQKVAVIYYAKSVEATKLMEQTQKIEQSDSPLQQYQKEIHNERVVEIRVAKAKKTPVFFILSEQEKLKSAIILDSQANLVDTSLAKFNLIKKQYIFLLRTDVTNVNKPLEFLENLGCALLTNKEQEQKVLQWEEFVSEKLKKRKTTTIKLSDFDDNLLAHENLLNIARQKKILGKNETKIFIKTQLKKGNAGIIDLCNSNDFYAKFGLSFQHRDRQRSLIISEVLDIQKDLKNEKLEYRVWVAGGEPSSYSRYVDEKDELKTPLEIKSYAVQFCKQMRNVLPPFYVLDVALTKNKGVTLVECNPVTASGRYLYNDISKFLDDTNSWLKKEPTNEQKKELRFA